MQSIDAINTLLGVLVPIVTGWLTTATLKDQWKTAIAAGLVVLFSVASAWANGQLDFSSLSRSIGTIALVALGAKEFGLKYFQGWLENKGPIKNKESNG